MTRVIGVPPHDLDKGDAHRDPALIVEAAAVGFSLVPGSKNDLYQRMEAEPALMAAKEEQIQRSFSPARTSGTRRQAGATQCSGIGFAAAVFRRRRQDR